MRYNRDEYQLIELKEEPQAPTKALPPLPRFSLTVDKLAKAAGLLLAAAVVYSYL